MNSHIDGNVSPSNPCIFYIVHTESFMFRKGILLTLVIADSFPFTSRDSFGWNVSLIFCLFAFLVKLELMLISNS